MTFVLVSLTNFGCSLICLEVTVWGSFLALHKILSILTSRCNKAENEGILRNPDRTWTRTRRKSGLGKNPDSCSDSRLRNPDSTIENPDSKTKIPDSMKLDSDNIRNKFSRLICFWVSFSNLLECLVSHELSLSL